MSIQQLSGWRLDSAGPGGDQTCFVRDGNQLRAIARVELGHCVTDVGLDRGRTDNQLCSDLVIGASTTRQRHGRHVNDTDEFHPMHLHGHVFTILAKNGQPLTGSPVHQDSVLVRPHDTWDVAFVADNPGLWMLHCHVLIHAAFGLDMLISCVGISTPFDVGTRSGNRPE